MGPSYILYHIIGGKLAGLSEIALIIIGVLYMYGPKIIDYIKTHYIKNKIYSIRITSNNTYYLNICRYLVDNNYCTKCSYFVSNLYIDASSKDIIKLDDIIIESYCYIEELGKDTFKREVLVLNSTISIKHIEAFIHKCKEYANSVKYDKLYILNYENDLFTPNILDYIDNPINNQTFDNIKYSLQKDILIKELDKLNDINNYKDGKRRKLTLMLEGKPGCGKSYHVQAMALYTKRHLVTINMNNVKSYKDINNIFNTTLYTISSSFDRNRCILFFDELDKFIEYDNLENEYKKDKNNISVQNNSRQELLSMLLEKLDGVGLYDGDIFIAAANDISKFHPALLRAGRFKVMKFNYLTVEQLQDYGKELFGSCPDLDKKYDDKFSHSEIFSTEYADINDYLSKLQELYN